MPAPVFSLRIFAHAGLTAAGGLVGPVVPAGLVYILRDMDALEISGNPSASMEVLSPLGQPIWFISTANPQIGANFQWRGRQVYSPGERVGFQAFSGTWSVMASGYQLTLP